MNNEEARRILSAYRPNGSDASTPGFREALEQARNDPELAAWFKKEREFDAEFARAIQSIPVSDAEIQQTLFATERENSGRGKAVWMWGALAAGLALVAGAFFFSTHDGPTVSVASVEESVSPVFREFIDLAKAAMPFDYRADSVLELRSWLDGQGAPFPSELPAEIAAVPGLGCTVFEMQSGQTASLICFAKDGYIFHLFVTEGDAAESLAAEERAWSHHDGWNAVFWVDNRQTHALLSQGPVEMIESMLRNASI